MGSRLARGLGRHGHGGRCVQVNVFWLVPKGEKGKRIFGRKAFSRRNQ